MGTRAAQDVVFHHQKVGQAERLQLKTAAGVGASLGKQPSALITGQRCETNRHQQQGTMQGRAVSDSTAGLFRSGGGGSLTQPLREFGQARPGNPQDLGAQQGQVAQRGSPTLRPA